nr:hypothetical protein [Tanacetum cinerariifolium]
MTERVAELERDNRRLRGTTSVETLSTIRADLIPSPKRVRDSSYLGNVEVGSRETSLRDDVIARGSDEPHLDQDIDLEIDECFAYADALRDRGVDARVVVEAVDQDKIETGVRGPVEVRVERITHPAMLEDIPEPTQEGVVEDGSGNLWVKAVMSVKGVPWVGNGGISGVSLSVVSSSNDKNGETVGNGGMWSDDGSSNRSDSISDAGGVITGVVSGIVVGIVPNKITRPAGVPTLSSDESDETEITEIAMTCTSKVYINHLYINHA